jgi:hypothetical protein
MKYIKDILLLATFGIITIWAVTSLLELEGYVNGNRDKIRLLERTIEELRSENQELRQKLNTFGITYKIIQCESGGRHNVWGDLDKPYPSYGITQIQHRTFRYLSKKAGYKNMQWKNRDHQIKLLNWAVENKFSYLWTCGKKYDKS